MGSKKKNLSIIILSVLILYSCDQKVSNVYLDNYFSVLYGIDSENAEVFTVKEFETVEIPNEELFVSPLLYNSRKDYFSTLSSKIIILGEVKNIFHENHHMVEYSTLKIYEELVDILNDEEYIDNVNKLSVIIDDYDELDKQEIKVLEQLNDIFEFKILKVRKGVTKSSVKRFVERNKSSELWIIDCTKYSLYAYDNLEDGKVIIRHGHILQKSDEDIIYSIERDYSTFLEENAKNDDYLIEEYLKKY